MGDGKFYTVYPPMPAILSIPFVILFGETFPQQYIAHLVGAAVVTIMARVALHVSRDTKIAIWTALLTGGGTILWFLSSVGSVWYMGQVVATFFMSLALLEALTKRRPWLAGILVGAAYLSRLPTVLAAPFIFYLLLSINTFSLKDVFSKSTIQKGLLFTLGVAPFFIFNALYNLARFGVPWDQGYFLLPAALNETNAPWFKHGVMNVLYISENVRAAFWSFPKILNKPPYIQPSWAALSIWITTPAFIFSVRARLSEWSTRFGWLTVLAIFFFDSMHGGTGWAQFGYRFAVDFYPVILYLTIKGVSRDKLRWYHWALLLVCIIVNLWGVLWINKFNWVSF